MTLSTGDQAIVVDRHADRTATVRLNRPHVKNALNNATRQALAAAFTTLAADRDIRVPAKVPNSASPRFASASSPVPAELSDCRAQSANITPCE
jgi:hypothetical protein